MNQHKKSCATCPFSKRSTPGELGSSPVEMLVGQAYGAFWLPCHEHTNYEDPNWKQDYSKPQCAGAAIYRSNCHPAIRPDVLLNLQAGSDKNVFKSPADFVAHHMEIDRVVAQMLVNTITPSMLHELECRKDVKFIKEEEFNKTI